VDLVVSEVQAERGDSSLGCCGSVAPMIGGGDGGVAEHPRQRDLGHADAARRGDLLDGVDDRLVEG
jgi:hypothetical protein